MTEQNAKESVFSPKESDYMAAAMMSLTAGIPTNAMIDTAKFASLTGLKEGSAKVIWNKLRHKIEAQGNGGGVVGTPKTPASKRKVTGGEGNGDDAGTPTKKSRAKKEKVEKAKKAKAEVAEQDDEANVDEIEDEEVKNEETA